MSKFFGLTFTIDDLLCKQCSLNKPLRQVSNFNLLDTCKSSNLQAFKKIVNHKNFKKKEIVPLDKFSNLPILELFQKYFN